MTAPRALSAQVGHIAREALSSYELRQRFVAAARGEGRALGRDAFRALVATVFELEGLQVVGRRGGERDAHVLLGHMHASPHVPHARVTACASVGQLRALSPLSPPSPLSSLSFLSCPQRATSTRPLSWRTKIDRDASTSSSSFASFRSIIWRVANACIDRGRGGGWVKRGHSSMGKWVSSTLLLLDLTLKFGTVSQLIREGRAANLSTKSGKGKAAFAEVTRGVGHPFRPGEEVRQRYTFLLGKGVV